MIRILAAVLVLAIPGAGSPARAGEPGRFLVVSDLHFDPFFDGSLFPALRDRPVADWPAILAGAKPAGFNPRGTDSNAALVGSALDDARSRLPSPDFVLYPGDFLAHDWAAKYDRLAPRSPRDDPVAYRAFTDKTIAFLARAFADRFPGVPVLPTLGNEDSYCGDYEVGPDGPFLARFAETWAPLLGPGVDRTAFTATFRRGGYYTLPLPGARGVRLVVLNSVFFSVSYDDACGPATATPALDQLDWLDRTLAEVETSGEVAWLLMHVPPGINSYNSTAGVPRGEPPVTFWQPELTSRFLQVVGRRRRALGVGFAGHTHMDDYRSVSVEGEPILFLKIAPAISPIFGNNPGYQAFTYDRAGGSLLDFRTYALPGLSGPVSWGLEYSFHAAYGPGRLNARGIADLASELKTSPALASLYSHYYGVGVPAEFPPSAFELYRCAIAHVTPSSFLRALDGPPRPHRPGLHPDRRVPAAP